MDSFFERERHDDVAQAMYEVISEERFRHYTIKCMRHEGLDSLWIFYDDELRGVLQWMEMLTLDTDHQYVLRFPEAINGLAYAQWVPEDNALPEDEAVAISRLERYYFQAYPEARNNSILFRGRASVDLDPELDQCTILIGGIPLVSFVSEADDMRLIDSRSGKRWGYMSEFQTMVEEDVQAAMVDVAQYTYEYLVSLMPHPTAVIH